MTASELKYRHEKYNQNSSFFDRETMKFFGDTMRNFGVRQTVINTLAANGVPVFELYRKRPVKYNNNGSHYFTKDDFSVVFPI